MLNLFEEKPVPNEIIEAQMIIRPSHTAFNNTPDRNRGSMTERSMDSMTEDSTHEMVRPPQTAEAGAMVRLRDNLKSSNF